MSANLADLYIFNRFRLVPGPKDGPKLIWEHANSVVTRGDAVKRAFDAIANELVKESSGVACANVNLLNRERIHRL